MILETETALLAKLRTPEILVPAQNILPGTDPRFPVGTNQPQVPFNQDVGIDMQMPDEWLATDKFPSINVWRLSLEYDPTRFRVGVHKRVNLRPDGSGLDFTKIDTKLHALPFIYNYEFGFRARFQIQMVTMIKTFYRRFPSMGFGKSLIVVTEAGDVEVPWDQINYVDLTESPDTGGERDMQIRITYALRGWIDNAEFDESFSIQTIDLRTHGVCPLPEPENYHLFSDHFPTP
jgi:hypothetical protein